MNKIAIVYWSGTGNTEEMAKCIADGVTEAGGEAVLLEPGSFTADSFGDYSAVAFGCPSMGSEELEETEFEPMFSALESSLEGKRIALFGSYGWGDGQWMRDWCERCKHAELYDKNGLIANDSPNDAARKACRELGVGLVKW